MTTDDKRGEDLADEQDFVLETSCAIPDTDEEGGNESKPLSKEEEDAIWARLPKETDQLCDRATGMLFLERYESFVNNQWPYDVKRGNLCHPRALALAGFGFHTLDPSPTAQCQVCLLILEDLKPNSNPWKLHCDQSPDCYLVSLGQRDQPDDYTVIQLLQMAFAKIAKATEIELREREDILKQQLYTLRKKEMEREAIQQVKSSSSQKKEL